MSRAGKATLGLLVLLAAALGAASRGGGGGASPVPSIHNPGPRGLKALALYLAEGGQPIGVTTAGYDALPDDAGVLVLALPLAWEPGPDERAALRAWVERGGSVLLLLGPEGVPGDRTALTLGAALVREEKSFDEAERELSGAVRQLLGDTTRRGTDLHPWLPTPATDGVVRVRVRAAATLVLISGLELLGDEQAAYAAVAQLGEGRVLALARPDPATNHWIGESDALGLVLGLLSLAPRAGPILFDEHHLQPKAPAELPAGVGLALAQLALVALVFAGARGRRLGAALPTPAPVGVDGGAYVRQLGALYRSAGADEALAAELLAGLRRRLRRLLAVAGTDDEALEEACVRRGQPRDRWLMLVAQLQSCRSAVTFAAASRAAAALEQDLSTAAPSVRR